MTLSPQFSETEQEASAGGAGGTAATAASMQALNSSFRERFVIFMVFSFSEALNSI